MIGTIPLGWPTLVKIAVAALCSYFILSAVLRERENGYTATRKFVRAGQHRLAEDNTFDAINNETLGFEHIYAIGLKERTDKRDFMTLASSAIGINVDWLDGVHPDEVSPKSIPLPEGLDISGWKPTVVASWRAHMNALHHIIKTGHTTALILEDDADFDISIRLQLREFARAVRTLTSTPKAPRSHPYGLNWDVLWIGNCNSGPGPSTPNPSVYAIPMDPTLPSVKNRGGWGGLTEEWMAKHPDLPAESTRFVYRAREACCTYGYAVTYEGARKMLASMSVGRFDAAVDNMMSEMCGGGRGDHSLRCYAPFPNIVGTYKAAGSESRDSDIESGGGKAYHPAKADNVVFSTRLNLGRLLAGEEVVESQWKGEGDPWSMPEVRMGEMRYPGGFLVRDQ